jgi:hypothetical protein
MARGRQVPTSNVYVLSLRSRMILTYFSVVRTSFMSLPPSQHSLAVTDSSEPSIPSAEEAALLLDSPPQEALRSPAPPNASHLKTASVPSQPATIIICSEEFEQQRDVVSALAAHAIRPVSRRMTRFGPDLILDPCTCLLVSEREERDTFREEEGRESLRDCSDTAFSSVLSFCAASCGLRSGSRSSAEQPSPLLR